MTQNPDKNGNNIVRIAITGGIGSGKSHVCHLLEARGYRVYDCDAAAKRLMTQNAELRAEISRLIGHDAYDGDRLNKQRIAAFLMQSEQNAARLNAVVHPAVFSDFLQSGIGWVESAILYESGLWQYVDHAVCVAAPLETRISRVMKRDAISREKVLEWMARQLPQEEVAARADLIIINDGIQPLEPQIDHLLETFVHQ